MNYYEEGIKILDEMFGNGKDNAIALGTIALEPNEDGNPRPVVRVVDAYYENGTFYVSTYGKSNKMQQIAKNPEISVAGTVEMFSASGTGENLGWVLDPKNEPIRAKLRTAFAEWYDMANNEQDENCCILAIHLKRGTLIVNHWEKIYHLDFESRAAIKSERS